MKVVLKAVLLGAALVSPGFAAEVPAQPPVAQSPASANGGASTDGTRVYSHWQLYNRVGTPVSGQDIARAKAVERAVDQAEVAPDSKEAALIRMGMGQPPRMAYARNDAVFDGNGKELNSKEVAEYLAIQEAMARGGVEPGSEKEAEIVAAAKGQRQTEAGEPVEQKTYEEMAKEIAIQEAIMRSGAQPGSANEAMIRTGADVLMERMKSW